MYYPTSRHPGGVAVPAFIGVLGIAGRFEFPPTLQVLHHGAGFSRKRASSMGPPALTRAHASSMQFGRAYPGSLHLQCNPVGRTPAPCIFNAFRSGVPRLHACDPAGLSYPALPALASIFCIPTSLALPLHTCLRPARQLAAQPARQPQRSTRQPPVYRPQLPLWPVGVATQTR